MKTQIQTRIGLAVGLILALLAGLAPRAEAADVTLSTNAWLNGSGQLTNATQGVLLTKTSGTGTQADPYVFDVTGNLNLGSYTILGNTANSANQYSATWRVTGNVTGPGNFDSYTTVNSTYGGNVHIEAGGTIALNRVNARANYNQNAGSVYLWATGTVAIATYIDTRTGGSGAAGAITIRSEGPVAGQGITISGSVNGDGVIAYSILTEAKIGSYAAISAGAVSLYCQNNITLAAGISTRGFGTFYTAGAVLIRGDVTDGTARAGTVSIGGTGGIRTDTSKTGGNVTVRATALQLTGGIMTTAYAYQTRTGNVDIDVLENATIGGFIDTRMLSRDFSTGSPGYVKIVARRTRVEGTNANGVSILTWPGTLNSPGSSASVAGDADVTLTNVNTSAERYDPLNPTNSMTSSIYVAGKINTGRWQNNNNSMGNIRIAAVEVQLGGDLTNSSSTVNSIMSIHYGTNKYGVVTHLVENGVRWDGIASHNIGYYLASGTNTFTGDVPYAGRSDRGIYNQAPTGVTTNGATFNGYLETNGISAASVYVLWGGTNGAVSPPWAYTNWWNAGDWTNRSFPATNMTLSANANYYYKFGATNSATSRTGDGEEYLITGEVTVQPTDPTGRMTSEWLDAWEDTATFTVYRPASCTNEAITVAYTLAGTAMNGTHYTSSPPATGTNGTVTIPAGRTNAVITVDPLGRTAPEQTVVLALLPGNYAIGSVNSATCTLGAAVWWTDIPFIENRAPSGVTTNGATFNGYLETNGISAASVYVLWGGTNGAVSPPWAYTNWWNAGDWTNRSFPATNMTLSANANYYYKFGATNSATSWTGDGEEYLITGEVTVQPTDPTGRVTIVDTAAFTVYRPASCTNEAITVAYTLAGTATNGTHYTSSPPANGTNGTVTIPAGRTNAVITVDPLNRTAPEQTVVLSLLPGSNYAIGSANSATCTLAAATAYVAQAEQVLVVYNANSGDGDGDGTNDSLQVANHYMAKRGVPGANILGLNITKESYVFAADYAKFQSEMVQPIKAKLSALGDTSIDIILLCSGIPTLVLTSGGIGAIDNALIGINLWTEGANNISWWGNPYRAIKPTFEPDIPHFTHGRYKLNGAQMYLVSRIFTANQVAQALYGERYIYAGDGYYNGNLYVDSKAAYTDASLTADPDVIQGRYYDYVEADKNIAYTAHYAIGTGLNCLWEQSSSTIGNFWAIYTNGVSARTAPRTLFYAGWYGGTSTEFEWLAGSVGCHLHSTSFGGPGSWHAVALNLGAAGVCGTVDEPYLTGHQRPNVLIYYMLRGYSFAEASMLATPSVGWMPMNAGDPLYTPMKAKTPVVDTQYPVIAPGYPTVTGSATSGTRPVNIILQDTPEPEVARIRVDYGLTTGYGSAVSNGPAYVGLASLNLKGLQGGSTYHYRITLTDPVGNVTVMDDLTFTTGAVPNTAPVAASQPMYAEHDAARAITLLATDAEGNALTYSKVDGPSHGTVTISGSTATYTPTPGYSGPDSFTFKANDGALDSNTATVSLTVMPMAEVTVVLQQGLNGYTGAKDATISGYGGESPLNYGGSTALAIFSDGTRSCALAFNLASSVPVGSTIAEAMLEVYATQADVNRRTSLYRMTHDWVEGTGTGGSGTPNGVTYGTYDGTNSWTPGGNIDPTPVAQFLSTDPAPTWLSWNIRDLVLLWVSTPSTNFGVNIRNEINREGSIMSKETSSASNRPKLTIRYYPPPPLLAVAITSPLGGAYVTNSPIAVTGTASNAASVLVNGTPATTSNGYTNWTCTSLGLSLGSNTLEAVASDGALLVSTATVHIVVATDYYVLDNDGVPALWKIQNWGFNYPGNSRSDASADPDNDGMLNWQEYEAATSPTNGLSRLGINNMQFEAGSLRVSWSCGQQAWQILEHSTNLADGPAGWKAFWSNPPPNSTDCSAVDPAATNGAMFYRVRSHR